MLERARKLDRDRTLETRAPAHLRDGHRREYDPRRHGERLSFRQRCERAFADVGIYRSISFRDLAEARFGGHPYTTRRAVNRWIREGLMREHTAKGPKGGKFKVLTLTPKGADRARRSARRQGLDSRQRTWSGLVKAAELTHDTEVYRACGYQLRLLSGQGASIRRIRIDAELKSVVARRSERARVQNGKEAADATRRRIAQDLGLPVDEQGHVLYPDAQLEYMDAAGHTGRVNIEVASSHYREPSILAKANAGFAIHATGAAKARVLQALRSGRAEGNDGTKGPAQRDPGAFEL